MRTRTLPALFLFSFSVSAAAPAHAQRLVPAYDASLHAIPPLARLEGGGSAPLQVDAGFAAQVRRPRRLAAPGQIVQRGEVLIMQGDDTTVMTSGSTYGVPPALLPNITRRVIAQLGDNFDFITLWLTFMDAATPGSGYQLSIKNDVQGINTPLRDMSAAYGSDGRLRSLLNMKLFLVNTPATDMKGWDKTLGVWGQESAHGWLIRMMWTDPRTGQRTDTLLGRDCAHWSLFVDSQASVEDGRGWQDDGPPGAGNHTFTLMGATQRYGNVDLYAMGLMASDEVPPFFLVDEVVAAGGAIYTAPRCGTPYETATKPVARTITGKRVDVTIENLIQANGERIPAADDSPSYWREANVLVTLPAERPDDPAVVALADRLELARGFWEQWQQQASQQRRVICTKLSADCGDPRSDVLRLEGRAAPGLAVAPSAGPVSVDVDVKNTGARDTTGVKVTLEVTKPDGLVAKETKDVGALAAGAGSMQTFAVSLAGVPCGAELPMKASSQSDFHYHRRKGILLVGAENKHADGFESDTGWRVDPDGTDTTAAARWERATPRLNVVVGTMIQREGAATGDFAWVTGAAAGDNTWVAGGNTTLESPEYDVAGLREPRVLYTVGLSTKRPAGSGLEESPDGSLVVLARTAGGWTEIDRLQGAATSGWTQRIVRLPADVASAGNTRFRFVAEDRASPSGAVEAVIDDFAVAGFLAACPSVDLDGGAGTSGDGAAPDGGTDADSDAGGAGGQGGQGGTGGQAGADGGGGCGCRTAGGADRPLLPICAAVLIAWARRRRGRVQCRRHAHAPQ